MRNEPLRSFDRAVRDSRVQDRPQETDAPAVARGVAWIGLAASLVSVLDLVALAVVLRNWVSTAELGVAALAITLFPILDLATDLGLSAAVIQRDDPTPDRVSTVFWLNVAMSLLLVGALVVGAPLLGKLHGHPVVGHMLLAYAGKLVLQNVYFVPAAMLRRELRFREISILRVVANVGEFAGKIGFAWGGLGVWCFVLGPLVRVAILAVGTQMLRPFRPRFVFRLGDARAYVAFGLRSSASQILYQAYANADYQIVALFFGDVATGLYRIAFELVLEPVRVISSVVTDISFPVFARLRDDRAALVERLVAFSRQNLVVISPVLVLIAVDAEDLLAVFAGPAWVPAAAVARILCATGALRAVSLVLPSLLDGIGRPGTTLAYVVLAAALVPTGIVTSAWLFGARLSYASVAWGWAFSYPIAFAFLVVSALRAISLGPVDFGRRLVGIPLCAVAASFVAAAARWAADPLPAPLRLAAVAAAMLAVFGLLLARFEGITPASVRATLRTA